MASSVDGCLVGRDSDDLDANKSWKNKVGVRGLLQQFFEFSPNTDNYNLTTGQAMVQTGINARSALPKKENLRLIVLDRNMSLSSQGVRYLAESLDKLILVVGQRHPALRIKKLANNVTVIKMSFPLNLSGLMRQLRTRLQIKKVTIQSAGLLNSRWLEEGLVDYMTVIIFPLLIGSSGTPALINDHIFSVKPLRLVSSKIFNNNYLSLYYRVIN